MTTPATCPECNAEVSYIVDGQRMSLETMLALPVAPKKIHKNIYHQRWCTRSRSVGQ